MRGPPRHGGGGRRGGVTLRGGGGVCGRRVLAQQLRDQFAVADHRDAQVLGAGFAAAVAVGDLLGLAVRGERRGVVDGQLGELLLVVVGRVAAGRDQVADQHVGLPHRVGRGVDEVRLQRVPAHHEPGVVLRGEFAQFQLGVAALAVAQVALGVGPGVVLGDGAVVLGAETAAQRLAAQHRPGDVRGGRDGGEHDQQDDDLSGVHRGSSFAGGDTPFPALNRALRR
ncbi:hypothetical protein ACFQZ4_00060 [Catellatospora coxensis]